MYLLDVTVLRHIMVVIGRSKSPSPTHGNLHDYSLDSDGELDVRVRVILGQLEVFESDLVERGARGTLQCHLRQWPGLPGQLLSSTFEVVAIDMHVATGIDNLARLHAQVVGHHHQHTRIASDVERKAEAYIC